jgi:hypothetical protein
MFSLQISDAGPLHKIQLTICSFTVFPSSSMVRILKSTPIAVRKASRVGPSAA